jgi:hypothetical protein
MLDTNTLVLPERECAPLPLQTSVSPKPDLWLIESAGVFRHLRVRKRSRKVLDPGTKGDTAMLTRSKIALSIALVLATASTAVAAPKHPVRHPSAIARQLPAGTYLSLAAVRPANTVKEPANMRIQDQGFREYLGDGHGD